MPEEEEAGRTMVKNTGSPESAAWVHIRDSAKLVFVFVSVSVLIQVPGGYALVQLGPGWYSEGELPFLRTRHCRKGGAQVVNETGSSGGTWTGPAQTWQGQGC